MAWTPPNTFVNGTIADATDVNENFTDLAEYVDDAAAAAGVNRNGVVRRGKRVIPGIESTTSTSYVALDTSDVVEGVVLPTDGLIFLVYRALWRTVGAEAAIFLNNTQVKAAASGSAAGVDIAGSIENSSDTSYGQLITTPTGLGGTTAVSVDAGWATAGQALGLRGNHAITNGGTYTEDTSMPSSGWGGVLVIEADAGTYDVGVRFRHVSGTQTYVKERKLRVWTEAF